MTWLPHSVFCSINSFALFPLSSDREPIMILEAPSAANFVAASKPMPAVAPVISTVFPVKDLVGSAGGWLADHLNWPRPGVIGGGCCVIFADAGKETEKLH